MGLEFRLNTPTLHYSVIYSSAIAPSLQPQQWQHFVDKSAHLAELILRGETQHRRGDTHIDPFLNQVERNLSAARAPAKL